MHSVDTLERSLDELLRHCTVRLLALGKVGGTGFFVAPSLILTCAHVVELAWNGQKSVEVYWHDRKLSDAQIKMFREKPYPDLALLQIEQNDHPYVFLDEEVRLKDDLYSYGYPEKHLDGDSATFTYEGLTSSSYPLLKFKAGQTVPGMSGAPLLNIRTGKVCGVVQSTRDSRSDLGGRAIPTRTVFQEFPELITQQEEFHKQGGPWSDYLASLHMNYEDILDSITLRELLGPTVRLVNLAEVPPASEEEVWQYYEGTRLSWNILAAQGDIERDLGDKLIKNFSTLINRTRMLCLTGEPGSGKSTLAWRVAAEVAQATRQPLLHILDNKEDEVWYKLEATFEQYEVPLTVLVDDVFRDYDALEALASLRTDLNVTIIATSRSNEIPEDLRLPFELEAVELGEPTLDEKNRRGKSDGGRGCDRLRETC